MYKLVLKFIWQCKGSRTAKSILKKEKEVGRRTLPDLKTYYKDTERKITGSWTHPLYEHKSTDRWISKSPATGPHGYGRKGERKGRKRRKRGRGGREGGKKEGKRARY